MSLLTTSPSIADAVVGTGLPALPRVNLLPPEIAERARLRRLQAGLVGGVLVVAGAVTALHLAAAGSVHQAEEQLQATTSAGGVLRAQSAEFSGVLGVYADADSARATLQAAMGQEVRYSQLLDRLSRSVPEGVWLKTVGFSQTASSGGTTGEEPGDVTAGGAALGTVTFSGVAFRHDDVAAWLESLAGQEGYANPTFTDSTATEIGKRQVVTFTSTVQLTAAALSQRWTAGTGG